MLEVVVLVGGAAVGATVGSPVGAVAGAAAVGLAGESPPRPGSPWLGQHAWLRLMMVALLAVHGGI